MARSVASGILKSKLSLSEITFLTPDFSLRNQDFFLPFLGSNSVIPVSTSVNRSFRRDLDEHEPRYLILFGALGFENDARKGMEFWNKERLDRLARSISPDHFIVVVGTNENRILNKKVIALKAVRQVSLISLMRRSLAFVSLSDDDNMPNMVVEAQLQGCQIVTMPTGNLANYGMHTEGVITARDYDELEADVVGVSLNRLIIICDFGFESLR